MLRTHNSEKFGGLPRKEGGRLGRYRIVRPRIPGRLVAPVLVLD